jgi:hypothetical protein
MIRAREPSEALVATYTLRAFKGGGSPQSQNFDNEQAAYAETMRLQKSGSYDAVMLVRVDGKQEKTLFDTTGGAKPKQKRSKLLPILLILAVIVGTLVAFAIVKVRGH